MGYEFLKVERYKAAFGHFNRAIKITGFDAPADCWYYAIYCLLKLKRFDEALVLCERARDLYPDYTDIIYLQGCCSLNLGYLQQAAQCYNRCIQMGEAAWEKYTVHSGVGTYLPRCGLAEVYLKQGQITSCLNNYKIAAGYPEAVCRAVPSLTRCIIMNFGPGRVLPYLRDNGLDSCRHLCTAAVETAKSGCLMESLELWQAALDKMKKLNDLSQYPLISSTMFQILGGIYAEAVEHNPNNAHLQAIAPFFKG
nr:tetratricopeptide repeat protein [Desulforadius tongensis]